MSRVFGNGIYALLVVANVFMSKTIDYPMNDKTLQRNKNLLLN